MTLIITTIWIILKIISICYNPIKKYKYVSKYNIHGMGNCYKSK